MMAILETALLVKLAPFAAKAALKSAFMVKMAGLKAYLASYIGSQAAGVTTSILAAGCAAMYYEKKIKRNSDEAAVEAAVQKGMSWDAAQHTLSWLRDEGWL